MGLFPGDHVRVAYLTQDGTESTFREFMLSPDGVNGTGAVEETIHIPARLTEQIEALQMQADETEALTKEIRESHQRLLSWADMFDTASPAEKKMIASYLIKAVILSRDYGIQVEFNVSEAQYLGGMEMG